MSCSRTQHNVPGQGSNTDRSHWRRTHVTRIKTAHYPSSWSSPMPPFQLHSKREEKKPARFLQILYKLFCVFSAIWWSAAILFYQNLSDRKRCTRLPRYHIMKRPRLIVPAHKHEFPWQRCVASQIQGIIDVSQLSHNPSLDQLSIFSRKRIEQLNRLP